MLFRLARQASKTTDIVVRIRRIHVVHTALGALLGHRVIPGQKRPARIDHGKNIFEGAPDRMRIMGNGDNGLAGFPLEPRATAGVGHANDALDVRRSGKSAADSLAESPIFAEEQDFLFLHHAGMS
ncbi:hypothetical protein SCL_0660 [Sulfuricaulis limicola]|uniref:Uncharacterized protein n=1 Tax=Sulfuricaulis limicola TaxID=1620215 RepID=A0A1B4XDW1_9GAMM|nr:hypothetical protein SCL_0660 [Sulfuricaulis limicola]